jgi:hypothetical protein
MSPALAAWAVAALLLLDLGVTLLAVGWPGLKPRRGKRRAGRATLQLLPGPPVASDGCPSCNRNAGHDDDCYLQRQIRRAKEIEIPREGEIK